MAYYAKIENIETYLPKNTIKLASYVLKMGGIIKVFMKKQVLEKFIELTQNKQQLI